MNIQQIAIGLVVGLILGAGGGYLYTSSILHPRLTNYKSEANSLSNTISELTLQANELNDENELLEEEILYFESQVDDIGEEKAGLTRALDDLQEEHTQLLEDYTSLESTYVVLSEDYGLLRSSVPEGITHQYMIEKSEPEGQSNIDLIGHCGRDYLLPAPINADIWEVNITIESELSWQPVHITIYTIYEVYPPDFSAQPFAPYARGEGAAQISLNLNCSFSYVVSVRDAYTKAFTGVIRERWYVDTATIPPIETTYNITSSRTSNPPIIDGIMDIDEWRNAQLNLISLYSGTGNIDDVKLFVMNDVENIYFSFNISVSENDNLMIIRLADNYGKWDAKHSRWDQGPWDRFWNGTDWDNDSENNVEVEWEYSDGYRIIEWSVPLNSGDEKDVVMTIGEKVKMGMRFGIENTWAFPEGYEYRDAITWGNLIIP